MLPHEVARPTEASDMTPMSRRDESPSHGLSMRACFASSSISNNEKGEVFQPSEPDEGRRRSRELHLLLNAGPVGEVEVRRGSPDLAQGPPVLSTQQKFCILVKISEKNPN